MNYIERYHELVPEEIKNLSDLEQLKMIEDATSWDQPYILEIFHYLCNWYSVVMIDEDGEWRDSDEVFAELKAAVKSL